MAETQRWKESDTIPPSGPQSAMGSGEDYSAEITQIRAELAKLSDAVGGTVKSTVGPLTRQLEAVVTRNPTTSVLVAAGVGLLLGLMRSR